MANVYFLNAQGSAQDAAISIMLNSGPTHVVDGFKVSPPATVVLGLAANKDKDVLGTDDVNLVVVTTLQNQAQVKWQVQMSNIKPDNDIQFLVFNNDLVARQGSTVSGFTITRV